MTIIWHSWSKTKRPRKHTAGCSSCRREQCDMWRVAVQGFCQNWEEAVSCIVKLVKEVLGRLHHPPAWYHPSTFSVILFFPSWRMVGVDLYTFKKSVVSNRTLRWCEFLMFVNGSQFGLLLFFHYFLFLKCWFSLRSQTSTEIRPHNTTSVHSAKVTVECGYPNNTLQLVHNKHLAPVFPGFSSGEYGSS